MRRADEKKVKTQKKRLDKKNGAGQNAPADGDRKRASWWHRFFDTDRQTEMSQRKEVRARQRTDAPRMSDRTSGEFDPGSERTLAACLTHASRMRQASSGA